MVRTLDTLLWMLVSIWVRRSAYVIERVLKEIIDMPGGIAFLAPSPSYFGGNVSAAVNNGSLSEDRVDDMCRRILTPFFYLGQTSYPQIDGSSYGLNCKHALSCNILFMTHLLRIMTQSFRLESVRCPLQFHPRPSECRRPRRSLIAHP